MGMIGSRCGNYVLSELLGRGGMGAVYRATHPTICRQVAIKVLDKQLSDDREHTTRFAEEAATLASMGHPNIVDIYDFGQLASGQFYFVMELLRGCELKPLMRHQGTMGAEEVAPYLQQMCAGLQAAHDKGIVHRDVKPANVFVMSGQAVRLKVLDFGISKNTDKAQGPTKPGMMMGTPTYMAPEQVKGSDPVQPAADLYALGVILYEMLAGKPPFEAPSVFALLAMHLRDAPPPLSELAPEVPPPIAALVMRCIAKRPRQRPASAKQLWELYAEALDEADLSMMLRHANAKIVDELGARGVPKPDDDSEQGQAEQDAPPQPKAELDTPTTAPAVAPAPKSKPRASAETTDVPPAAKRAAKQPPAAAETSDAESKEEARDDREVDPKAASGDQGHDKEAHDKDTLITELLAQMRRKGDFPAISKSIHEIQRNASITGISSARQLAGSIQKDYALSTKLLRVVNSAYYERSSGRISSVARAVVMLGFEQVRDTAIGLTVFPKAGGRKKQQQVVDSTVNALMSGVLATKLAASQNVERSEEAFACGLFATLGRQLVLFYLPERHDRILAVAEARGLEEEAAARRELGVTYDELGGAIAKRWRLADVVCDSIAPYEPESSAKPRNDAERVRASAALANEICSTLAETPVEKHEAALEQLLGRYADMITIKGDKLAKLVETSMEGVRKQFGDLLDFDLADSTLFRHLVQVTPPVVLPEREQAPTAAKPAAGFNGQLRAGHGHDLGPKPVLRIEQGIRAIEEALAGRQGVGAVLRLAMQTAHEGLELRRVVFMAYTARGDLEVRAALGDGSEQLKGMVVPVHRTGDDPFSAALVYRKDRLIIDERDNATLPEWCQLPSNHGPESALVHYLYPIEVFMKPAGLLYADGRRLGGPFLPYLDRLRNYVSAAMRGS
jgi:serine/threonine protein kinase/HD-like signal output (HDOD) protein